MKVIAMLLALQTTVSSQVGALAGQPCDAVMHLRVAETCL